VCGRARARCARGGARPKRARSRTLTHANEEGPPWRGASRAPHGRRTDSNQRVADTACRAWCSHSSNDCWPDVCVQAPALGPPQARSGTAVKRPLQARCHLTRYCRACGGLCVADAFPPPCPAATLAPHARTVGKGAPGRLALQTLCQNPDSRGRLPVPPRAGAPTRSCPSRPCCLCPTCSCGLGRPRRPRTRPRRGSRILMARPCRNP